MRVAAAIRRTGAGRADEEQRSRRSSRRFSATKVVGHAVVDAPGAAASAGHRARPATVTSARARSVRPGSRRRPRRAGARGARTARARGGASRGHAARRRGPRRRRPQRRRPGTVRRRAAGARASKSDRPARSATAASAGGPSPARIAAVRSSSARSARSTRASSARTGSRSAGRDLPGPRCRVRRLPSRRGLVVVVTDATSQSAVQPVARAAGHERPAVEPEAPQAERGASQGGVRVPPGHVTVAWPGHRSLRELQHARGRCSRRR